VIKRASLQQAELTMPTQGDLLPGADSSPAGLHGASCATQKELLLLVNGELTVSSNITNCPSTVTRHGGPCVLLHDAWPPRLATHFDRKESSLGGDDVGLGFPEKRLFHQKVD